MCIQHSALAFGKKAFGYAEIHIPDLLNIGSHFTAAKSAYRVFSGMGYIEKYIAVIFQMRFSKWALPYCKVLYADFRESCAKKQQAAQRQCPAGNRAQGRNFLLLPWREQTEPLLKNGAVFQNGRIADV